MRFFASIFAAVLLMAAFSFARAGSLGSDQGESYAIPNYRELTQTLMMLDGLDITNPQVANDYARMFYCDLYKANSTNDFDWQKIRTQIVQRVTAKKDYYRIQYQLSGTVFLNVYNFETQDFPFTPRSALVRVGQMLLMDFTSRVDSSYGIVPLCGYDGFAPSLPLGHTIVMSQTLTFDRLKMPMDEAKTLLERMQAMHNQDRRLYVRFRFRLQSIAQKPPPPGRLNMRRHRVVYNGELKQVDLFLDKEMTKFLTTVHVK